LIELTWTPILSHVNTWLSILTAETPQISQVYTHISSHRDITCTKNIKVISAARITTNHTKIFLDLRKKLKNRIYTLALKYAVLLEILMAA
jgi:hypothetical protein